MKTTSTHKIAGGFSEYKIKSIKHPEKTYETYDDNEAGLGLRIQPSGRKVFILRYQLNRTRNKITLGLFGDPITGKMSYKMAREAVQKCRDLLEQGIDPATRMQQGKFIEGNIRLDEHSTMSELAAAFLKFDAAHNKKDKGKNDGYMLNKHILPKLGDAQMRHIKRADLKRLLDDIRYEQGKLYQSNRVRALLSKIFNFAIEYEIVEFNPVTNIKPFREKSRDVYLETNEELRLFWNNLDKTTLSVKMRLCLRLCLVTGQRISQVLGMTRDELDLEQKEWTISKPRTKHKKAPHIVPLTDLAIELITEAMKYSPNSEFVFESDYKPGVPIDHSSINTPLRNNLGVFKIAKYWRPHDLRRTVETHMNRLGINFEIAHRVTDHISGLHIGTSKVYNQYKYRDEKRRAMETWCKHLQDVINRPENKAPTNGNVVDFTSHRNKPK